MSTLDEEEKFKIKHYLLLVVISIIVFYLTYLASFNKVHFVETECTFFFFFFNNKCTIFGLFKKQFGWCIGNDFHFPSKNHHLL